MTNLYSVLTEPGSLFCAGIKAGSGSASNEFRSGNMALIPICCMYALDIGKGITNDICKNYLPKFEEFLGLGWNNIHT